MQSETRKTVKKVGFISPPAWFDISPTEFLRVAPDCIAVMQTIMRLPDFKYDQAGFINAVPELGNCFESLAAAGADVVAQFGYPFALVHGWENAQQIQKQIQGNSSAQFLMMGVEIVQALRYMKCKTIAVASTYYSAKTAQMLDNYLLEAGFTIAQSDNWQSLNLAQDDGTGMFIGGEDLDPMDWQTPVSAVQQAVRDVVKKAPGVDGILVTGGGMRLLDIVEELEKETSTIIIGGDISIYWGILRRLKPKEGIRGYGKLLASLDQFVDHSGLIH